MPGADDRSGGGAKPGFTINDRRGGGAAAAEEPRAPDEPAADVRAAGAPPPEHEALGDIPPVDFHTFMLSLGSSALMHLGEIEGPDGEEVEPDLALAKHTIDVIAMLQQKTKGNLTEPEEKLVESLLYDLRLRYVELSKP